MPLREFLAGTGARCRISSGLAAVLVCTILVNAALVFLLGFRYGGDTLRFTSGADALLHGQPLDVRQQVYFGYIWLLAGLEWIGVGWHAVYAIQLAASCLAAAAAFHLGRLYGSELTGAMTGLTWVALYEIHKWNVYLLTDALFISSVMVASWLVVRSIVRAGSALPAVVATLVMASLRFNGVVFAVVLLGWMAASATVHRTRIVAVTVLLALALLPSAAAVSPLRLFTERGGIVEQFALGFMVEGEVIWDTYRIPMPEPAASSGSLVSDWTSYVVAHPADVARLYAYRLGHYLTTYNPRFSTAHNVANLVQWTALYLLAIPGWIHVVRPRTLRRLAWLPLLWVCHCLLVVVRTGENDGRFSLYAAPALLPFVGVSLGAIVDAVWGQARTASVRAGTNLSPSGIR